jgi:hypothetical protein
MLTELLIIVIMPILVAFAIAAIVINIFAIALYIFCKSVEFMYSPTRDKIFTFTGKIFSTVLKVTFSPAIWVFERL